MYTKDKRVAIIAIWKDGSSVISISKLFSVPRIGVYYAIKQHKQLGTFYDRPKRGRTRSLTHQPIGIKLETNFEKILNIPIENSLRILKSELGLLEILLKISYIITHKNYGKFIFVMIK